LRRHSKQLIHRVIIEPWASAEGEKKGYCLGARMRMAHDKAGNEWQHPQTVERRPRKTCGNDIFDGCVVERGI
jgi:hypothetical protein